MQVYQYLLEAVNINLLIPKFIIVLYLLYYSYTLYIMLPGYEKFMNLRNFI